jgi:hypothetical protein
MVLYLFRVSLGATRRPSLLGPGTRNFTRYMAALAICTIRPDAPTVMAFPSARFSPFPKVSTLIVHSVLL